MNVASLLRWSAASLISVFAASLPVHSALAEGDGMSQDAPAKKDGESKINEHTHKKKDKVAKAGHHQAGAKAEPKEKKKPVAKASSRKEPHGSKSSAKKDAPLAKGAKNDDAKPAAAEGTKDEHKTTRLRKKVHRHDKK